MAEIFTSVSSKNWSIRFSKFDPDNFFISKLISKLFIENQVPRAVALSGGARRRSWTQAPRREYMGKIYILNFVTERKSWSTGGQSVLANKGIM